MNKRNDASPYQLPKGVVPRHYDLLVRPDFDSFRFSGRVVVDVEVREPVDRITVHSLGLKITSGARRRQHAAAAAMPS